MTKNEFINEINRTIPGINLTSEVLGYEVLDTSAPTDTLSNSVGAVVGTWNEDITITLNGKTKTYRSGNGTTFPCEFIADYKEDYYS